MPKRDFEDIYNHVIRKLDAKLPDYLSYHCTAHTLYVLERSIYIAHKEKVGKKHMFVLKVAALFHDIGFINTYDNHEEEGCKIARKDLTKFNVSKSDIEKICGLIKATKIPQRPLNHLEEILADADLEYLATNQFYAIGDTLYKELKHFNPKLSMKKWNQIQITFLDDHHYHTAYCRRYKEFRKRRNLALLIKSS